MTAPDLLPCPFCNGKAEDGHHDAFSVDSSFDFIGCVTCKAMIEYGGWVSQAEAIAAWNTRATPAAMTPEVQALVDAIESIRDYGTIITSRKQHKALEDALAALRAGGDA